MQFFKFPLTWVKKTDHKKSSGQNYGDYIIKNMGCQDCLIFWPKPKDDKEWFRLDNRFAKLKFLPEDFVMFRRLYRD